MLTTIRKHGLKSVPESRVHGATAGTPKIKFWVSFQRILPGECHSSRASPLQDFCPQTGLFLGPTTHLPSNQPHQLQSIHASRRLIRQQAHKHRMVAFKNSNDQHKLHCLGRMGRGIMNRFISKKHDLNIPTWIIYIYAVESKLGPRFGGFLSQSLVQGWVKTWSKIVFACFFFPVL